MRRKRGQPNCVLMPKLVHNLLKLCSLYTSYVLVSGLESDYIIIIIFFFGGGEGGIVMTIMAMDTICIIHTRTILKLATHQYSVNIVI